MKKPFVVAIRVVSGFILFCMAVYYLSLPRQGGWVIERGVDPMNDRPRVEASLRDGSGGTLSIYCNIARTPSLLVRAPERLQGFGGSPEGSQGALAYRIDHGAVHNVPVYLFENGAGFEPGVLGRDGNADLMLSRVVAADTLNIQVESRAYNRQETMVFHVAGASAAWTAVSEACH